MGGIGSGRSKWKTIDDTVECPTNVTYDVLKRYREGKIKKGAEMARPGSVLLEWTPCNFGGVRPWYLCPGENCGRRVRFLYEPQHTSQLQCRHCWKLRYASQALSKVERLRKRIRRSSARLGASGRWVIDLKEGVPEKPGGMHHTTYNRILQTSVQRELTIAESWRKRTSGVSARVQKAWCSTLARSERQAP